MTGEKFCERKITTTMMVTTTTSLMMRDFCNLHNNFHPTKNLSWFSSIYKKMSSRKKYQTENIIIGLRNDYDYFTFSKKKLIKIT